MVYYRSAEESSLAFFGTWGKLTNHLSLLSLMNVLCPYYFSWKVSFSLAPRSTHRREKWLLYNHSIFSYFVWYWLYSIMNLILKFRSSLSWSEIRLFYWNWPGELGWEKGVVYFSLEIRENLIFTWSVNLSTIVSKFTWRAGAWG